MQFAISDKILATSFSNPTIVPPIPSGASTIVKEACMSTAKMVPVTRSTDLAADKTSASAEERARRTDAVAGANGHSFMEGLFGSALLTDLETRYISGELEIEDAIDAAKRHYGLL